MSDFIHLHCHSEYSLLDGAIKLKDLCAKAKDLGMPAAAVTDHGNLYAALHFYLEAKKVGIKPIIGCEVYVCHDHTDRTSAKARERFHLILLAQNLKGYHNLVKLVSHGALYGFYSKPRVDKPLLQKYSEGIIALSACLAGEVPRTLQRSGIDAGISLAKEYANIYPDRFFLEVQSNGIPIQDKVNEQLIELSTATRLPVVATNDCHYLDADDYDAHDILLCIQTQAKVNDERRMRFDSRELYYKTPEEMEKSFSYLPESLSNTLRIADMVEEYNFDFKSYHFPVYDLPEGMTLETEFCQLARDGLEKRLEKFSYEVDKDLYKQRLERELSVICEMKFPGYFLIVQDFINWAKNNGVPVGPGRGSAAGSLVAYALRITNLDPIPYNLLFERFLNIERISMPDIDVDFCEDKRQRVIEYVGKKYGSNSVAQITTFGKMLAKGVIRDVGRAIGMSFQETDRIAKLIPSDLKMTIKKALIQEPDLATLYNTESEVKKLIDTSIRLEGLSRHASVHAAGLVISDKPMNEYLPLYRGKREEDIVTQYDMKMVEKVGLVKFDFLGLRNMTVIDDALKNIAEQGKEVPDLDTLPLDDEETYKLYSNGDTDGVFQVESSGMRQYLRMLKPSLFEDIIAMLALYRPGPLKSGMVTEFIKRKHGQIEVSYPLPSLESCLKDTYGVIVYQEQVMQIAQTVGGYTLGGADLLRRAMGKKDPAAMAAERSKFVEGAKKEKVSEEKANEIFDLMEKFAEYGFNKSHSAAYALISYHTAFLKVHYKTEFMAALLSSEMGNQDKLLKYVAACKDMEVSVLSPDIQKSQWKFTVDGNNIVFGLGGIKNVGVEAVKEVIEARKKDGPFVSFLDFCVRVSSRKMTKRVLESLIKAGACDCFGVSRAAMVSSIDTVVTRAQKLTKDKESNQISLFSIVPENSQPTTPGLGIDCPEQTMPEWTNELFSQYEKEALGFFFSSHPLLPFRRECVRQNLVPLEECREMSSSAMVKCAVLVTSVREIFSKKGDRMAFCQIEDLSASGECVIFPKLYAQVRDLVNSDIPLYLEATNSKQADDSVDAENSNENDNAVREIKLVAEKIIPLAESCFSNSSPLSIEIDDFFIDSQRLEELKAIFEKHKGEVSVYIMVKMDTEWCKVELAPQHRVQPGPELEQDLAVWGKSKPYSQAS